ncbi:MAG: disulfide bond formation protein B [Rhodospirillales bacterium]|jgi:disulfide bond formation protein DsbB|nr:disulfide bond formation protein B [Rhodospirillales bacterium]MBT4040407.1 disulfide bond formation protein B [Rhodospirillales bacterium]MBT4625186.1 disulfide bond formation protein B [Rhodospirillales bacterium]MBT5351439.1 disulfide bond formation protein B [Rhodospirillales bacterium]MBT5521972.1 disulfide bond formation protein B [Rhodospirillales bacterium]
MNSVLFIPDGSADWPRLVPVSLMMACLVALATAYTAQYVFHIEPCVLCLYQRVPYAFVSLLTLAAILMPRGSARRVLVGLCIPLLFIGSGIAFYHVGVEQHWWVSAAGCGGSLPGVMSVADLQASLLDKPAVSCDQLNWALFGISMAAYNSLAYLVLGFATLFGLKRMQTR